MNLVVDGWTNRVAGQGYDAAGNMTHAPGSPSQTLGWDAESRMTVAWGVGGIWNYTYGAGNERVEALGPADGSRRVYFYDVTGELLGEYSVLVDGQGKLYPKQERMRASFAGRPLEWEDRLGSKVVGPIDQQTGQATRYRYYPYGQNIGTNVGWDDVQFATYTRDGATGLDYARNRYYTRTWGRFLSPDPCVASGGPADPGSWNRYAYVQGDPVNFNDPGGLCTNIGLTSAGFGYSPSGCSMAMPVWGPRPSNFELYGQGNAIGIPGVAAGQAGPGSAIGTASPELAGAEAAYDGRMTALTVDRLVSALQGDLHAQVELLRATTGWQLSIEQSTMTFLFEDGTIIIHTSEAVRLPDELVQLAQNTALTGSVYIPAIGGVAGPQVLFSYHPAIGFCLGAGLAFGVGKSFSVGTLTGINSDVVPMLSGFSVSLGMQVQLLGVQWQGGSPGAAAGYSAGSPGITKGFTWSMCP